ncbi:7,8-dihydropterin-6-yl-methyl-4-(beta-D-ribofuranosyl)aminobenzene 5'-phosphate synthase [Syntrophus gentianae]|uniref:7,8-dihydropterin-6-yl-methyl-4-(Beta-D-ribofuranosyl)aminobenzene 5'-phosphate synthase n=1 Tax=Syntrophus gentianae TaxID=43775 RepID=A0A1H7V5Q8_9BACT|nr:MBL fold metallo-hydrolase [Syntrophus gentianae]SEM04424.1 7,8-dihydropterin-6-yl-methyl-4-(beta-D-ribofuranosyl)aminobenzene 5'-phosphate synthase [Syntrophus gentianae]
MQIRIVATGSTPQERREGRWGLSLLLGESVLLDTFGMADLFWDNLCKVRGDVSRIRHVVLSHEHWDHIEGLEKLAEKNSTVTVYICPHTEASVKAWIRGFGMPVVEVDDWLEIEKGVFISGEIAGTWSGNPLWEQIVVIQEQPWLSVLTGCAHPGLFPILQRVQNRFADPITLLMGGFHLMNSTEEGIAAAVTALRMFGVQRIAPTHCTGEPAVSILRETFGNRFVPVEEGGLINSREKIQE